MRRGIAVTSRWLLEFLVSLRVRRLDGDVGYMPGLPSAVFSRLRVCSGGRQVCLSYCEFPEMYRNGVVCVVLDACGHWRGCLLVITWFWLGRFSGVLACGEAAR